jgi:ubiquinone/menaquinone biosynthesis C-methylase UbiE
MAIEHVLPLPLPPSPFIRSFANSLPEDVALTVLDAGACEGRNSRFIAQGGHLVVALTKEVPEAIAGAAVSESILRERSAHCQFVAGDVRQLPFSSPVFDVVLANEVFHQMTKYQARAAIKGLDMITKPSGIHAVSGYVVNPREASPTNRSHCFYPNELLQIYTDAGWKIHEYAEDVFSAQEFGGRQIVNSLARIVATR